MLKELVGGVNTQFSSSPTKPMPLKSIDCSPHPPPHPGAVQGTGWPLFKAVSVDQSLELAAGALATQYHLPLPPCPLHPWCHLGQLPTKLSLALP